MDQTYYSIIDAYVMIMAEFRWSWIRLWKDSCLWVVAGIRHWRDVGTENSYCTLELYLRCLRLQPFWLTLNLLVKMWPARMVTDSATLFQPRRLIAFNCNIILMNWKGFGRNGHDVYTSEKTTCSPTLWDSYQRQIDGGTFRVQKYFRLRGNWKTGDKVSPLET